MSKCSQKCLNMEGSYKCGCENGFELQADQVNCKGLDAFILYISQSINQFIIWSFNQLIVNQLKHNNIPNYYTHVGSFLQETLEVNPVIWAPSYDHNGSA